MLLAPTLLTTLLTFGSPQASCPRIDKPPTVRVDVEITQPSIDHRYPRSELKKFQITTVSPYGADTNVHVNGLMRGEYALDSQVLLVNQSTPDQRINCTWYDRVYIKLTFRPVIYVASEIPAETCLYREVLNHEYRHYATDYDITATYQKIFEEDIGRVLAQSQVVGPYGPNQLEEVKQGLMRQIDIRNQSLLNRMKTERIRRQSMIDTREEYERVVGACRQDAGYLQ